MLANRFIRHEFLPILIVVKIVRRPQYTPMLLIGKILSFLLSIKSGFRLEVKPAFCQLSKHILPRMLWQPPALRLCSLGGRTILLADIQILKFAGQSISTITQKNGGFVFSAVSMLQGGLNQQGFHNRYGLLGNIHFSGR